MKLNLVIKFVLHLIRDTMRESEVESKKEVVWGK